MTFAGGHFRRRKAAVLPAVDEGGQRARRPALLVDVVRVDHLLHQAQLVVGVEDGEIRFEAGELGVTAQHARADGVERAQPLHAFDHAADQRADALLHLARGLVGEGDGQQLPGPGAARGENVGEAGRQHTRLAGSGAGQHQHGSVHRHHRFALLLVEPGQIARLVAHDAVVRFFAECGV